ncbi:hypothetical protein Taro_016979 [Colocasia esculenta]|uniref:Uncharacterized protein n=1 Tax=Colocasia esculenta TaxID=4460 RepID=A0A843UQ76_COLES|nr:hypothetical protein [Colocasia esculenta]
MCVHVCRTCHDKPAKLPEILLEMARQGGALVCPPPGREGRRSGPLQQGGGGRRLGPPPAGGPPAVRRGRRLGPLTGGPPPPPSRVGTSAGSPSASTLALCLDARAAEDLRRGGYPRRCAPLKSYK